MTIDGLRTLTGRHHPATSRLAALAAEPRSGTQRRAVYDAILARGDYGATDDELVEALRIPPNSLRPRRVELADGGHIERAGRTRLNRHGHACDVWIPTRLIDPFDPSEQR